MRQADKAATLRALHRPGAPLLLPNVWDPAGARMLEEMGWAAVATSSAAIASAHGYPDGERIPKPEMLAAIARIAAAVAIPVSADIESAYGASLAAWAETARELLAAGAVGCNLEDSAGDPAALAPIETQVGRLEAVRAAVDAALVINARTDACFLPGPAPAGFDPAAEAIRRARAYRAAGADCVFVPGLRDLDAIGRLLAASPGPLNILAGPGAPAVAELAAVGVARISLGSGPYRAALAALRRCAEELRGPGTYTGLESAPSHSEVNRLLAPRP